MKLPHALTPFRPAWFGVPAVLAIFLLSTGPAGGAIRTVTNLNDGGAGSLRATITAANSGDTIQFAVTGTITLVIGPIIIDKSLIVEGPGSPEMLILEPGTGEFGEQFKFTIMEIEENVSPVRLSGLTMRKGQSASGGGGLKCSGSSVTVSNCVFTGNTGRGEGGGAIFAGSCALTVDGCTFSANTALSSLPAAPTDTPSGGAIRSSVSDGPANLIVQNCSFRFNIAERVAGAVSADHFSLSGTVSTATIIGCTFTDNRASGSSGNGYGGAVSGQDLRVSSSTFTGNSAPISGAIDITGRSRIEYCTFLDNDAYRFSGGAVGNSYDDELAVTNCLFHGNEAIDAGGAMDAMGLVTLQNCTFSANDARKGGAVMLRRGTLLVNSCTFSGNTARPQGATGIHQMFLVEVPSTTLRNSIFANGARNLISESGPIVSEGYNLSDDDDGGVFTGIGDQPNTNPLLDPLGPRENGGPTKTIALLAGSPALDGGFSFGLFTDQRAEPRPRDLPGYGSPTGGDGTDIGAMETHDPVQPPPLLVTTLHDHDDGMAGQFDCTLREAMARAGALGGSVPIAFSQGSSGVLSLDSTLGPLTVTSAIQLTGPGARQMAITTFSNMRVFLVTPGATAAAISGITIRDGAVTGLTAGGTAAGAGLVNEGVLTLQDCALANHQATGATGVAPGGNGGSAAGAGIFNSGNLTLIRCTIRDCTATAGHGADYPHGGGDFFTQAGYGGDAAGGAIYNTAGASLAIFNCTLYNNRATGGDGGDADFGGNGGHGHGAAILNAGAMNITSATVTENTGIAGFGGTGSNFFNHGANGRGGGGLSASSANGSTVRNSIIGNNYSNGNARTDVLGAFNSEGYNLITSAEGSTGFTHATDQTGTAGAPIFPNLGPLQNNGGATDTMQPLSVSAAVDKGNGFGIAIDQRWLSRPMDAPALPNAAGGDGSDIGAVEADVSQPGPEFVVNSLDDHDDGSASYLDCTLREAINAANAAGGANIITLEPNLAGVIALVPGLGTLTVSDSLTFPGPGARKLEVRGNGQRVFAFIAGTSAVSGITIRNGTAATAGSESVMGGGIFNQSSLTVSDCTLSNNMVTGGEGAMGGPGAAPAGPGGHGFGGGIANAAGGSLTLFRCTFTGNSATGGFGGSHFRFGTGGRGGDGRGGAVFNAAGGTLTVQNCTLHGNMATGGPGGSAERGLGGNGGDGHGAAIFNAGSLSANSLTVTANMWNPGEAGAGLGEENNGQPGTGAGALFAAAGSSSIVRNSISSSNLSSGFNADVAGAFTSGGYNLISDPSGSTGFSAAGDQTFADPRLGPLQDNGGPNDTCALLPGSAALDRGHSGGLTHDQRLQRRPYDDPFLTNVSGGDGSDTGALELRPPHTGPPEFILIETTPAGVHLCVQGSPLTPYQLHRGDLHALLPAPGAPVTSDALGLVEFIDPGPLPGRRFYQVVRTP